MDTKRILVVEDDSFLRQIYSDTLSAENYSVDVAVDGEEGFAKLKIGGYDVVLLDILMPKMNGFEVVEKLKTDPEYKGNNKVIIYLTNLDNEADIKRALELGNGYLIKSQITPGDLAKEVKMYTEKSSIGTDNNTSGTLDQEAA
ncbi:MAG TPA: response regulator [Candidatus Saccharimonadales bacterium]|nr:response regulator [Candidatus Saccharimonadales bacterium]